VIRDSAYIWIGPLSAMLIAQILKPIIIMIRLRRFDPVRMRQSGGMPSSHTALVVALVTELWQRQGGSDAVLALAIFVAFIVMYDAAGVRWQTGRQAALLNRMLNDLQRHGIRDVSPEEKKMMEASIRPLTVAKAPWWLVDWPVLNEHVGHKPTEVIGGIIVGIVVALYMS